MLHVLRRIRSISFPFIVGGTLLEKKHFDIDENFEVDTDAIPLVLPNQRAWPNVTKDKYRKEMNDIRRKIEHVLWKFEKNRNIPKEVGMGFACAAGVNESIPHVTCLGYSDVENKVLVHDRTKMRVGTLSMPLTALLACHLVAMGFIEIDGTDFPDDPVEDKGYNVFQANISLQSMIRNYHGYRDLTTEELDRRDTLDWKKRSNFLQAIFLSQRPTVNDGTTTWYADQDNTHNFSRFAYVALGRMLRQIKQHETGKIMEEFFLNNGMADTVIDYKQRLILFRSKHYKLDRAAKKKSVPVNYIDPSLYPTVHGCMSTAYDIARLGQKILSNRHSRRNGESAKFANPHLEQIKFLTENLAGSSGPDHCVLGDIERSAGAVRFSWKSNCVGSSSILYMSGEDEQSQPSTDRPSTSRSSPSRSSPSRSSPSRSSPNKKTPRISVAILVNHELNKEDLQELRNAAVEIAGLYETAFNTCTSST